jgi:hypothetical protein
MSHKEPQQAQKLTFFAPFAPFCGHFTLISLTISLRKVTQPIESSMQRYAN